MNEVECILGSCLNSFVTSTPGFASIVIFGLITLVSGLMIINEGSVRSKIKWLYAIVFSVLFVLTYFTMSMICPIGFQSCVAILYTIPIAFLGSLLFAQVVFPNLYLAINQSKQSEVLSDLLPTNVPVYIADEGKPSAFAYSGVKSWIVVSQGMLEILTKKELTAVLLHEYGHLVNNSSFYLSSRWIYSKVPLLQGFLDEFALEDEEEIKADDFAIKVQGTKRYLNAAKRKIKKSFDLV